MTQTSLDRTADDQRHADAGGHVPRREPDGRDVGDRHRAQPHHQRQGVHARRSWVTCCRRRRRSRLRPNGASPASRNPVISGTGTPGDTVTVSNGTHGGLHRGRRRRTARGRARRRWRCRRVAVTLTATQADQTGNPSAASAPVTVTEPLNSTSTTGTVGGSTPATLALTLGAPAAFAPFVPGVAQGLHGVDHRDGGLLGRRRDADGHGPEHHRARASGQRRVRAAAGAAGTPARRCPPRSRPTRPRSPTTSSRSRSSRRSVPTTRCGPAPTARR